MKQYNPEQIFEIGLFLATIESFREGEDKSGHMSIMWTWGFDFEIFCADDTFDLSVGTREAGLDLVRVLNTVVFHETSGRWSNFAEIEMNILKEAIRKFTLLLRTDFKEINLFKSAQIRDLKTRSLIESGEDILSRDFQPMLGNSITSDLRESARALLFELPTASGFQLGRAFEAITRKYVWHFVPNYPRDSQSNTLGKLGAAILGANVGGQVWALLDLIRTDYRNPLAHPELTLTLDEAISMRGIYAEAMHLMLSELKFDGVIDLDSIK